MTFKKHHEKYKHRSENDIEFAIVEALKEFPRSTYGVAKAINADRKTALHNLKQLERLGRVRLARQSYRKFFACYWILQTAGNGPA